MKGEEIEPELTAQALGYIRELYAVEQRLATKAADDTQRLAWRTQHAKPLVEAFFEWLKTALVDRILLPTNPFTEAAEYALARERGLRVFLEYPNVPIDTNHLEREMFPSRPFLWNLWSGSDQFHASNENRILVMVRGFSGSC